MDNSTKAERYFVSVLRDAQACGDFHVTILLTWLCAEYFLFDYGVYLFTNRDRVPKFKLFIDGYNDLTKNDRGLLFFSSNEWSRIIELYTTRYLIENLNGGLFKHLKDLRISPTDFFNYQKQHWDTFGEKKMKKKFVAKSQDQWMDDIVTKFLTSTEINEDLPCPSHVRPQWRTIPEQFHVIMCVSDDAEICIDSATDEIIGGRAKGKLSSQNLEFIRSYMERLYNQKYAVKRSDALEAIGQTMLAVGASINSYDAKTHGKETSYYKNKLKLHKTTSLDSIPLEELHEQSSHRLLLEILLVLFAQNFWPVLEDFLKIQFPFTEIAEEYLQYFTKDKSHFRNGIPSYPLFITKDYCNMVHRDKDLSTFTMGLVSNPNMGSVGGYLSIVNYGLNIPLEDGDIFFFRGKDEHATSLRGNVTTPVYVMATALNHKLGKYFRESNSI